MLNLLYYCTVSSEFPSGPNPYSRCQFVDTNLLTADQSLIGRVYIQLSSLPMSSMNLLLICLHVGIYIFINYNTIYRNNDTKQYIVHEETKFNECSIRYKSLSIDRSIYSV